MSVTVRLEAGFVSKLMNDHGTQVTHHEWDIMERTVRKGKIIIDAIRPCRAIEGIPLLIYKNDTNGFSDSDSDN